MYLAFGGSNAHMRFRFYQPEYEISFVLVMFIITLSLNTVPKGNRGYKIWNRKNIKKFYKKTTY